MDPSWLWKSKLMFQSTRKPSSCLPPLAPLLAMIFLSSKPCSWARMAKSWMGRGEKAPKLRWTGQISNTYTYIDYITLHYITLHCITSHHITSHHIALHYITLHYITLHITYIYICICMSIYIYVCIYIYMIYLFFVDCLFNLREHKLVKGNIYRDIIFIYFLCMILFHHVHHIWKTDLMPSRGSSSSSSLEEFTSMSPTIWLPSYGEASG